MPLSKARDKERKKQERAKNRLDKLLSPPQTLEPVQPIYTIGDETLAFDGTKPDIDADGNVIPEM